MINKWTLEKIKSTKTRKLPWLPRMGFVLEIGGRKISYRQAPFFETIAILMERGVTLSNFQKAAKEQLFEIVLPNEKKRRTVNVKARTVSSRKIKK